MFGGKPVKAIIEHVRDGSTVRAFLLPDFYYITLMISGIRCPGVKLDSEGKPDLSAKVLKSCVLPSVSPGKRLRLWQDYKSTAPALNTKEKDFTGTVVEVLMGLASVVRYRQDDDQRSSCYDQLFAAENQAIKSQKGMNGKKDNSTMRVNDLTVDHSRIKYNICHPGSVLRTEGIVEFVASGSRLRLFIPKDSCLNILAGWYLLPSIISTNSEWRASTGSAEKSEYYRQLKSAEDRAKAAKKKYLG
ncbi:Staphylococcal nuclease domain-containing protein 1 [Eumeta japonica]|uniref:Staphylococcal nuclease domain-containing protein 1 n=1 Tax=Eumeta variegata TaxID=151549 RepID=A0A4C1SV63_EUMVA|nr:Staphylococcal nuclease domain-containing protein 1 [Eumeta japonica]